MPDLLTSDLVRYLVALEMLTLVGTAVFLHHLHHHLLPRPLLWMGRGLLSVVGAVAAGVIVNAIYGPAPTPGLYVVGLLALPAAAGGVWFVVDAVRHR